MEVSYSCLSIGKFVRKSNFTFPSFIAIGRKRIVYSGLMTKVQYEHAEQTFVERLASMREGDIVAPVVRTEVLSEDSIPSSEGSEFDEEVQQSVSTERDNAGKEWREYCNLVKRSSKNLPQEYKTTLMELGGVIVIGAGVTKRGRDIRENGKFRKCNLSDYIDKEGHFELVKFLAYQERMFPYIYRLAVCLSAVRTNEVGCERFFSNAGYVSAPRRSCLKVQNYEMISTLMRNIQRVYVDEQWVAREYLRMEKGKLWNNEETKDDDAVMDLEKEMHAEATGEREDEDIVELGG